jgi:hypothetical protein
MALICAGLQAQAQEVTLSLGWTGQYGDSEDNAAAAGLDVVVGGLFQTWRLGLGVGAAVATTANADTWVGAGPVLWLDLGSGWRAEASTMAGIYADNDVDLGGTVQFHSRLGLSYALSPAWRLGASVGHISNAGLYDDNPGIERVMIALTYGL